MDHVTLLQNVLEELLEGDDPQETAYMLRSLADEVEDGISVSSEELAVAVRAVASRF